MSFRGAAAEQHLIDAYHGGQALAGMGRTLQMISHYSVTGSVRRRIPFDDNMHVMLRPIRSGSVEAVFDFVTKPETIVFGSVASSIAGAALWDFVKFIMQRTVGRERLPDTEIVRELDQERGGDIEALSEAIEPAIRNIHSPIGGTANKVVLIYGDNNNVVFDQATKDYVDTSIKSEDLETLDVSVSSINVHDRTGRAYLADRHHTVRFEIAKDAAPRTLPTLMASLNEYAAKRERWVSITFHAFRAPDGRIKKVRIFDAVPASDEPT